jgi:hypothetical protein
VDPAGATGGADPDDGTNAPFPLTVPGPELWLIELWSDEPFGVCPLDWAYAILLGTATAVSTHAPPTNNLSLFLRSMGFLLCLSWRRCKAIVFSTV